MKSSPAFPRPTSPRSVAMRSSTRHSSYPVSSFQRSRMPCSRIAAGSPRVHKSAGSQTCPSASTTKSSSPSCVMCHSVVGPAHRVNCSIPRYLECMRVHVDSDKCQGHNRCYAIAPELFDVDELGYAHELHDGVVPP